MFDAALVYIFYIFPVVAVIGGIIAGMGSPELGAQVAVGLLVGAIGVIIVAQAKTRRCGKIRN